MTTSKGSSRRGLSARTDLASTAIRRISSQTAPISNQAQRLPALLAPFERCATPCRNQQPKTPLQAKAEQLAQAIKLSNSLQRVDQGWATRFETTKLLEFKKEQEDEQNRSMLLW